MLQIRRISILSIVVILIASGTALAADTTGVDVNKLIREIDRLYRAETSYTELEMEIVTPHWQRTLAMYGWSDHRPAQGKGSGHASDRQRDVELPAQDQQGNENSAVDDDGCCLKTIVTKRSRPTVATKT